MSTGKCVADSQDMMPMWCVTHSRPLLACQVVLACAEIARLTAEVERLTQESARWQSMAMQLASKGGGECPVVGCYIKTPHIHGSITAVDECAK